MTDEPPPYTACADEGPRQLRCERPDGHDGRHSALNGDVTWKATMSNEITIYGRSDGLIEIEGAVREELYADYGEPTVVEINPGYVIEVEYDTDGIWRIDVVFHPDGASYKHTPAEDTDDYTDVLRIKQPNADYEIEKR